MSVGTESGFLNWIRKTFQGHPKKKILPPEDIQKYVEEKLSREQEEVEAKAPNVFDVVVMYYFEQRQYDLFEINETLYYYDQPLLGAW